MAKTKKHADTNTHLPFKKIASILAISAIIATMVIILLQSRYTPPADTPKDQNFTSQNFTVSTTPCSEKFFEVAYENNHSECFNQVCSIINFTFANRFSPRFNSVICANEANESNKLLVPINDTQIPICTKFEKDLEIFIECTAKNRLSEQNLTEN